MELCPQGSCDLVQQVVLSFSAALPGVPTAAYPCFCRDGASHITPFPTPPTQKSPHYTQLSKALLDRCGSQSMLPLNTPGLENLLLVATLARKMMKDEPSRQEKQKLV